MESIQQTLKPSSTQWALSTRVNGMGINFKVPVRIIMNIMVWARRTRVDQITSHDFWYLQDLFKWRENLHIPSN